MPVITAQQTLALTKGILFKRVGGTATQIFSGVPIETLFTPGVDTTFTATLALSSNQVTVSSTANMVPGMPVFKTTVGGELGTFATGNNFVHSIVSPTIFRVGSDAQIVDTNLKATLALSTNAVTLTNGTTAKFRVGMQLTKITVSGEAGTFGNSGVVFVKAITGLTTFTVENANANADVSHSAEGNITFFVGGRTKDHSAAGAITFRVGGVDFENNRFPGLGDLPRLTYSLVNTASTVTLGAETVLAYLNGGDVNSGGTLEVTERDYHTTGLIIQKKIK